MIVGQNFFVLPCSYTDLLIFLSLLTTLLLGSTSSANPNPPKEEGRSIGLSIENPYALQGPLNKLESALDEIIGVFESEGSTTGAEGNFTKGKEGIELFKSWKKKLDEIKGGSV